MNALLRAQRAGVAVAPPGAYDGRLSDLGLVNGDPVTIPFGQRWLADLSTSPSLAGLTLNGLLIPDPSKPTQLIVDSINIASAGGFVEAGPTSRAVAFDLIVKGAVPAGRILGPTHNSSNVSYNTPNDGDGLARGIMIADGGRFELDSLRPAVTNTSLYDTHATAGATSIRIAGAAYWKAGWKFTLGMTKLLQSLAQTDITEVYTVAADTVPDASGLFTVVTLTSAVTYTRWGKLQYGTGAGMSLTDDGYTAANLNGHVPAYMDSTARAAMASAITAAISAGRPNVLDERASVSLLTRLTTISAPNDTAFSGIERFGVHIMKMGRTGSLSLKGVQIFNCGQGGALGRYPVHWHLNSINPATGAILGLVDSTKNVVQDCSISFSKNRAITFHGVHGARAINNSIHDILGHAIFLEDGSEMFNVIDGNFVSKWRDPGNGATAVAPRGYRIKLHDEKTTGLWVTNGNNYIRNNRMSDGHTGRWIVTGAQCFGFSVLVNLKPSYINVLEWDNNTSQSCAFQGSRVFGDLIDEQGTIAEGLTLQPRVGGVSGGALQQSFFTREHLWKNNGTDSFSDVSGNSGTGNYDNRVKKPNYVNWVVADCLGADFSGATDASPLDQGASQNFFIAKSLNVESKQNSSQLNRNGFASYHGTLPFHDNTFIAYAAGNIRSAGDHYGVIGADGVQETWDLYINSLETLSTANLGNHYIDSLPGWRAPGPGWVRHTSTYSAYLAAGSVRSDVGDTCLSMAMLDYEGTFGGLGRTKSFLIFDQPFLTNGVGDLYTPNEMGTASFQKVTQTPMYGIEPHAYAGLYTGSYPHAGNPYVTASFGPAPRYACGIDYYRCDPVTRADISGTNVTFGLRRNQLSGQHISVPRGSVWRMSTAAYNENGNAGAATQVGVTVRGMFRSAAGGWGAGDYSIMGVDWPGGTAPTRVFMAYGDERTGSGLTDGDGSTDVMSSVASWSALTALTEGTCGYWRDIANNRIWIRFGYSSKFSGKGDTLATWGDTNFVMTLGIVP